MVGLLAFTLLLAPPLADDAAQVRVVKAIKESERAGFERHRLPAHLDLYTRDAVFVRGRGEAPGPYDVQMTRAQAQALLALEYAAPPSRTDRLFFEEPEFDAAGTPPTVTLRISRNFFGGNDVISRRYTLRQEGGRWRVSAVRTWPIEEHVADSDITFNDAFWAQVDAIVDRQGTFELVEKLEDYRYARRYREAWTLLVQMTARADATAADWSQRAAYALRLGDVDDARASARKALALDALADLPPLLRGMSKKPTP
ncbi:MAG: hypothetical protein H6706_16140 [Myxococcales bacterium]|nr:hypothetical protein [Myxococcales bacterium]